MRYKYSAKDAKKVDKHGHQITIYEGRIPTASVVRIHADKGFFEEIYNKVSTFMYSIIDGRGTFMLNDEPVEAEAGDLIVIPPETRIHYFGTMDMVLTVSPAFDPDNEVHVRFVDKSESPYVEA